MHFRPLSLVQITSSPYTDPNILVLQWTVGWYDHHSRTINTQRIVETTHQDRYTQLGKDQLEGNIIALIKTPQIEMEQILPVIGSKEPITHKQIMKDVKCADKDPMTLQNAKTYPPTKER